MMLPAVDINPPTCGEGLDRLKSFFSALSGFGQTRDSDGVPINSGASLFGILTGASENELGSVTLTMLRDECWRQFRINPFVGTATRDSVDSLVGDGFRVWSKIPEIQKIIKRESFDMRNRLWHRMRQIVTAYEVTGENFIALTCDPTDKFVHIDYVEGSSISGIDEHGHGIISHPEKTRMPLFYHVRNPGRDNGYTLVPSINLAWYPHLHDVAKKQPGYDQKLIEPHRHVGDKFAKIGGFKRFIIDRESDMVCTRNISHLWSVLIWANFYTLMKSVEMDHKRALASFLWVLKAETPEAWDVWDKMTPEQKKQTGLYGHKAPGSLIIPPPGFGIECKAPQLTNITGSDNDIREMMGAGLKQPMDVVTGNAEGKNFGSVKASRGPWSDRILGGQSYFRSWCVHDVWRQILFLHQKLYGLTENFEVREAVRYEEKKPIFEIVSKEAWECISVNLPMFTSGNLTDLRGLYLGSKPAGLSELFGVSKELILSKLGISDYHQERLRRETEQSEYPETMPEGMSGEQFQEDQLGRPVNSVNTGGG